jgi:hypothetical protein
MASARREIRVWPALVGAAIAAAAAAVVVVIALLSPSRDGSNPAPPSPMTALVAVRTDDFVARVVTEEGGCGSPVAARARVRADAVEVQVLGQDPPQAGCTAEVKVRCSELLLPSVAAGRRLRVLRLAPPSAGSVGARARSLVADGPCSRVAVAVR